MAISMRNIDQAFHGAGQKAGIEIWRIENIQPVLVPQPSHGKFFTGDSYIVLKTTASVSGIVRQEIHYWLGKDTTRDEAGTAAVKTVELDAALGGRAVHYREVQGHETDKFLSYFKPCIMPREGGFASGFKQEEEHKTSLFVCKGKHVVRIKEVPFGRSTLNHNDIFILDTKSKIFQFNGSNSPVQERAKALEVVEYIKDTFHDGICETAAIEDGNLMADPATGEFWGLFGGFAPLHRKTASKEDNTAVSHPINLLRVKKEQTEPVEVDSLTRELLYTYNCYILDCGLEIYVWIGRSTSLDERKFACRAAEELICGSDKLKSRLFHVIEGFETVIFRSKFESWPKVDNVAVSEDGRGKVAALLQREGVNVKGLLKAGPSKDEPQPYIDCTGNLEVWRMNGQEKLLLQATDQSKFYSGDCYIFQYSYSGEDREEYLIGTWFGKQSVEEERVTARSLAIKMFESMKFQAAQACIHEGSEPIQFFSVLQSFVLFKGGLSDGYKKYITENGIPDETYAADGVALFRVQGSGPENMQAIQVEASSARFCTVWRTSHDTNLGPPTTHVASSLNSSYCYILHNGSTIFTWAGKQTCPDDQDLVERQLDIIKPELQTKPQKEGYESEEFWGLLGGKSEYPSQKISRDPVADPRLLCCTLSKGDLKVTEVYNFTQDDLMTEDVYILDCRSDIFVWVGKQVDTNHKFQALTIGEQFLEKDFLLEKLSREIPIYVVIEGNEPSFFTRFFTWDSAKSIMYGNSFQRKLTMIKNGGKVILDRPKRRRAFSYGGRFSVPEKSQRSRSVCFSPDRVRVRGKSPAFNLLAATFENPNARNLSTPPPMIRKLFAKSMTSDSTSKAAAIAALTTSFDTFVKPASKSPTGLNSGENSISSRVDSLSIQEEEDEGLDNYPYERLTTTSTDPAPEIDITRREAYLSSEEFMEKFKMRKGEFYKLPKWKQNKVKKDLQLF